MGNKKILKNKWYLYLTEFFAGMSVMAVELGASRLLAPYFSSSQIVWTIIIGTIMIAMALGNIWGGRSADKDPNPDKLFVRIIVASIWIAVIPVIGKYLILAISAVLVFTININFLAWAAFFSCIVLFVFPLFLLGTATPSLVKYTVESLDNSGKIVGTLGAFNTIGCIIGTFIPTFITIPAVGTNVTFLIFAGILLLLGLVYFISTKSKKILCIFAVIIFLICIFFSSFNSFAFWEKNLLYEGESVYNYLQVKETDKNIILSTNVLFGVQSIYIKDQGLTGMYYDYALLAPAMVDTENGKDKEVLILGMGTGTYATQCDRYYEGLNIEGVEIDQKITELASTYFSLPSDIKVTTYDGRAFLNATEKKYDVIMVDAYQDITIPFQLSSIEFFQLVKEHLNENGVMVVNMNMHSEEEGNINAYLSDTIASVFKNVYTVDVKYSTNRELFASNNMEMLGVLSQNIENLGQEKSKESNELVAMLSKASDSLQPYLKGSYLLTDDNAPVELLGMKVVDALIQEELSYYRDIYKREGIKGFFE